MKRPRGFTLIELLIVIGILLVLLGLATWGITAAQRSGRVQQTQVALNNLKGMYTELEVSGGLTRQPTHQWDASRSVYYQGAPTDPPIDIWNDGEPGADLAVEPDPLLVPHSFLLTQENELRFKAESEPAVLNTQLVMSIFSGVPSNRTMISQLPANGTAKLENAPETPTPPAPPDPSFDESQVPILLDGWQNPIIFVPSTGLDRVVPYTAGATYPSGVYVDDSGTVYRSLTEAPSGTQLNDTDVWQQVPPPPLVQAPDRRPFFASAGPDGSFAASDDNVYSFEN